MRKFSLLFPILIFPSGPAFSLGVSDVVSDKELAIDAAKIIGNLGLNCGSNPSNQALFARMVIEVLRSIGEVNTSSLSQLAMKKDFPTVCHVLTQPQIDSYYEEKQTSSKKVTTDPLGVKKLRFKKTVTIIRPRPHYYWPKYFVEVTEKGNDYHDTFAGQNRLYAANRKIAEKLKGYVDQEGALNLTKKVLGIQAVSDVLSNTGSVDWAQFFKASVLAPFERMRMRADQSSGEVTFDAAIWPVVLSKIVAEKFSVCRKGGYGWKISGLAQTCPLALSSDAYAYWDTGMLDYLDPQAVSSMALSANPATCIGEEVIRRFDQGEGQREAAGDRREVNSSLASLNQELRGALQSCSWPILGDAEAIAKKALSMTDPMKWSGPYCTLWGPLAPRVSTNYITSDYSYANKALQFKLFSHEFFGIPRGKNERWSLAYPWEGKGASQSNHPLSKVFEQVTEWSSIAKEVMKVTGKADSGNSEKTDEANVSRSEALLSPGSPLLADASYSAGYFSDRMKGFAREAVYLAGLTSAGEAAARAAKKALKKDGLRERSDEDPTNYETDLSQAEYDTRRSGEEPVWEKRLYCHVSKEREGTLTGSPENRFEVPGLGELEFSPVSSEQECRQRTDGRCLKRDWKNKCISRQNINYVLLRRFEISGYIKSRAPVIRRPGKRVRTNYTVFSTPNTNQHDYWFEDEGLVYVETTDTTDRVLRPDTSSTKKINDTIAKNDDSANLMAQAARSAAWAGPELARMKYAEMTGTNHVPGDRRIYTIWEQVSCDPGVEIVRTETKLGSISIYTSCEEAVKLEVMKYVHLKLLRRICDGLGQTTGKPWK